MLHYIFHVVRSFHSIAHLPNETRVVYRITLCLLGRFIALPLLVWRSMVTGRRCFSFNELRGWRYAPDIVRTDHAIYIGWGRWHKRWTR